MKPIPVDRELAKVTESWGIYLVRSQAGRQWCVLAESSDKAVEYVGDNIARLTQIDRGVIDDTEYTVGRIGTYDPGMTGARMVSLSGDVLAG